MRKIIKKYILIIFLLLVGLFTLIFFFNKEETKNEGVKLIIQGGEFESLRKLTDSVQVNLLIYYPTNVYSDYITIKSAKLLFLGGGKSKFNIGENIVYPSSEKFGLASTSDYGFCADSKIYGSGDLAFFDENARWEFIRKSGEDIHKFSNGCSFNIPLIELFGGENESGTRFVEYKIIYEHNGKESTISKQVNFTKSPSLPTGNEEDVPKYLWNSTTKEWMPVKEF
ncbi:MAG: hypothetical protein AABY10_04505 [Nanoarchaeota archaeon]